MKHVSLSVAIAAALLSSSVIADSWTLTQTTTPNSVTNLTQSATTGGSVQALNDINAASTTSIAAGSKQTIAMEEARLKLTQDGAVGGSTQAANYAKAGILGGTTAFTQEITDTTRIGGNVMEQNTTTGSGGNTQAMNAAIATANTGVVKLKQSASFNGNLLISQGTTLGNNLQAINTVSTAGQTASMTDVEQTILTIGNTGIYFDQHNAPSSNVQTGNNADAGTNNMGTVNQSVTAGLVISMIQRQGGQGLQALNRAVAVDVNDLDQAVKSSGTQFRMTQRSSTGDNAVQVGNILTANGVITDVDQVSGDSDEVITMVQEGTGTGLVQAGNLIDTSGGGSISGSGATQDVTAATLDMDQTAGSSLQVANALITGGTGSGGTLDQSINVATLEMTQTDAAGSFQAGNYAGSATP